MSSKTASTNISKISKQLQGLFQNVKKYGHSHGYKESSFGKLEIMNNNAWWNDCSLADFLTDVARHMRLGPMLGRDRYPLLPISVS
jgi:tyrosyl-tRNA synthetase